VERERRLRVGATVLVVDEDPGARAIVEAALRERGARVVSADSAAEVLDGLERARPDLVLCDVYLSDRVCELIKRHPTFGVTPVVLMADTVDRSVLARAARAGAEDVAKKPAGPGDLLTRIEHLLPTAPSAASLDGPGIGDAPDDPVALAASLSAIPGVSLVALVDHEGFVLGPDEVPVEQAELVAALAACLAESAALVGRELGRGALRSLALEFDGGLVFLSGPVAPDTRVAVMLRDPSALGLVRDALAASPIAVLEVS